MSVRNSRFLHRNLIQILNKNQISQSSQKITLIDKSENGATSLVSSITNQLNETEKINALDKIHAQNIDFLNEIGPSLKKSFNLAAYVNSSETLQQLLHLGVDLSKIEKDNALASFIVRCDFKTDIQPLLLKLLDQGLDISMVGTVLNKNPYLITMRLEDLQLKIDYFKYKKFNREDDIAIILINGASIFNLDLATIDLRLAVLGLEYRLSTENIRNVIRKHPEILLLEELALKSYTFMLKEEFGFNKKEIKAIILRYPELWSKYLQVRQKEMRLTFDYVHNTMRIPLEHIVNFPMILKKRIRFIAERHQYLKLLKRDQYDPTKPLYVPLSAFYELEDSDFCLLYAKTSVCDYNQFLKTL